MTIYIGIIAFLVLFDRLAEHRRVGVGPRRLLLVVALMTLWFVSAFRDGVGYDTVSYIQRYENIAALGPADESLYMEFGYRYFCYALYVLGIGPQGVFVVTSAVLMIALYVFITRFIESRFWLFAVWLFVCGVYYFASMNILRQYFALSILVFSCLAWSRRHYFIAFGFLAVAFTLQYSSAIVLLAFALDLFMRSSLKKGVVVTVYGLMIVVSVAGVSNVASQFLMLIPHWSQYADSHWITERNLAAGLKLIMPNALLLYSYYQEARRNRHSSRALDDHGSRLLSFQKTSGFDSLITAGTLCYVTILNCVFGIVTLTRLSEYFSLFYIAFVSRFLARQDENVRWKYWICIVAYYLLITVGSVFIQDTNSVIPYRTVLFNS